MHIPTLCLAVFMIAATGTHAVAVEMIRPFEVLERSRRAGIEMDKRMKREAAERQQQEKEQEAKRKSEEAEQRKRVKEQKAEADAQRKRDGAKAATGAGSSSTKNAPSQPATGEPAPTEQTSQPTN